MDILIQPDDKLLKTVLQRPEAATPDMDVLLTSIFDEITKSGDKAVRRYTTTFDKVSLKELKVTSEEFDAAEKALPESLKTAIRAAAANIERFHTPQLSEEQVTETIPGVICRRRSVPINAVGLYVPGGTAPLFSTVLMLGIPAKIANCPVRILCTPPASDGSIHPAILFAAQVAGIPTVFKIGGAQAIAAMAIGTETIPKVDKLFGPGNSYVTAAKQFAQRLGVAIDMPAGPSEVLVAADDSVSETFIAADLLAQAEHGTDSQVIFLTDSEKLVKKVQQAISDQLTVLPRAAIARKALKKSAALVLPVERWAAVINDYAPEHVILMGKYEEELIDLIVNAGSVFLGEYTAESFGDYASGTNHTLPTAGFARAYSGVSVDTFVKKITYQRVSAEGLKNLGPTVITMAEAESLKAHANAISVRLDTLKN